MRVRLIRVITAPVLCLAVAGCAMANGAAPGTIDPPQRQPSPCQARGHGAFSLPDRRCTPGVSATAVTQANIRRTICRAGYSRKVRPPSSVTEPEKLASMRAYGDTGPAHPAHPPHDFEYDHLISLELGGAPNDLKNLWPEPGASPNPKDRLENRLHMLVCDGTLTLSAAQRQIATDWVGSYRRMFG